MNEYFNRKGEPITMMEWARLFEGKKYKRIKLTPLWRGFIYVSTVWLGLNHSFHEEERPLIFESMPFCHFPTFHKNPYMKRSECGGLSDMSRYSTEKIARRGHRHMVKYWSKWSVVLHHLLFEHKWL